MENVYKQRWVLITEEQARQHNITDYKYCDVEIPKVLTLKEQRDILIGKAIQIFLFIISMIGLLCGFCVLLAYFASYFS